MGDTLIEQWRESSSPMKFFAARGGGSCDTVGLITNVAGAIAGR
jgi:hypothetical protein